jgi:bifunctional enzyme CysN/CysC
VPDTLSHLQTLEAESIHILREVAAEFSRPVMLYSAGEDSSVMLRLAQKAFYPAKPPFPLLHVGATCELREMTDFRDRTAARLGLELIVHAAREEGAILESKALVDALSAGGFNAALAGARREEEASRARERIYSFHDAQGRWDPGNQRPEPWNLFNARIEKGESVRVFPLSNWTELDVWQYIHSQNIPVAPLYFAQRREMLVRGDLLIPFEHGLQLLPGERPQMILCRMRWLGCARWIRSTAATVPEIIEELRGLGRPEREKRVIDHDAEPDLLRFTMTGGDGVAYRHFSTPRRNFIVAGTPDHDQSTCDMAIGASTAELAVIVLDARKGVLPHNRRHAYIAWLLGIRHIVAAVNKMDLAGHGREVFDEIRREIVRFAERLPGCEPHVVPMSALEGDTIVRGSLLDCLETVPAGRVASMTAFRLPVQYVIRPSGGLPSYAGQIASGSLRPGDEVLALPSGQTTRVRSIRTCDGDLERALAPMPVALCLEDPIDIRRGDMLAGPARPPVAASRLRATLVWMSGTPLALLRPYLLKHTSQRVCAEVTRLVSKLDLRTLQPGDAAGLGLNEIGTVELETHRPLFWDPYEQNFVLIDPIGNQTLAAGMIGGAAEHNLQPPSRDRPGLTVWFTGLSSAGKTTLSQAVGERLSAMGYQAELLDGDAFRRHLTKDLGFSRQDRDENIRRIGFVAELLTRNGGIALVAAISPYRAVRDELRARIGNFVEVYVNAPLEVCEQRDLKGLYRKVRAGQISGVTGIDDPYEPPLDPEVECLTGRESLEESVEKVLRRLETWLA